jgi:hypothetical protein
VPWALYYEHYGLQIGILRLPADVLSSRCSLSDADVKDKASTGSGEYDVLNRPGQVAPSAL